MAEFAYNNSISLVTKISSFFANYSFYSCFDSLLLALDLTLEEVKEFTSLFLDLENLICLEIRLA
jgi:hypothetical protein